jgi:hypothetical protein
MKYDELLRPGISADGHDHRGDIALFKRLGFSWVIGEADAILVFADSQPTRRSGPRTCSGVSAKLSPGGEGGGYWEETGLFLPVKHMHCLCVVYFPLHSSTYR